MHRYVVGVSGASGVILAYKTIIELVMHGYHVDLVLSSYAAYTASLEMGKEFSTPKRFYGQLPAEIQKHVTLHGNQDVGAAIASGSFQVKGMVIVPCSMSTVAAVAFGLGDNCLRRAADVTLKEKRPLIVVPREAPFGIIHLENLLKLAQAGATIIPPVPAWYNKAQTMEDVENFIVGKVLDALKIENEIYPRWKNDIASEEDVDDQAENARLELHASSERQ
jgi:flavin prenyltransferase